MDTLPTPLEHLAARHGSLRDFRVDAPLEIRNLLQSLQDGAIHVHLHASSGVTYTTTVWTLDSQREILMFAADGEDSRLSQLLQDSDVVAVAYLDSVKLQFDVGDLMVVRGMQSATLRASFPQVLWRFQRRTAFRQRSTMRGHAVVRLRHPQMPDMSLELRVLDVSIGGCALLMPHDVPALEPGTAFNRVTVELDPVTRLDTGLRLHHVTSLGQEAPGVRLGCSFFSLQTDAVRTLQRWLDQAQRRTRFVTIG
jgi:c-di-GMP-binding flagellar brake protein YcgR